MGLMINILTGVMIFISVVMVMVVLLQEDKNGGGIGMIGGSSQSFFGASSANFLTKVTTVLLAVFFVLSIVIGSLSARSTKESMINNNLVSELEFETDDKKAPETKKLTEVPSSILVEDFDKLITAKLTDDAVKTEIATYYAKDNSGTYYTITKDGELKKDRVLEILNSVGYTIEAQTTVIGN